MFGALPREIYTPSEVTQFIYTKKKAVMSPFVMFIVKQGSGRRGGNVVSVQQKSNPKTQSPEQNRQYWKTKSRQTRPSFKKKKKERKKG